MDNENNLEEDNINIKELEVENEIQDVNIDLEISNPDVDIIINNSNDNVDNKEEILEEKQEEKLGEKTDKIIDASKLRQSLFSMKDQIDDMLKLLQNASIKIDTPLVQINSSEEILGLFTGDQMRDNNGKEYSIAPNYASKSKLVEGDKLKLNITPSGSFIYKQVEQIPRKRLVGELVYDTDLNQWTVIAEGKSYKILKASVTFYKGNNGDEAVILVPETGTCSWGAVDNIIRKN